MSRATEVDQVPPPIESTCGDFVYFTKQNGDGALVYCRRRLPSVVIAGEREQVLLDSDKLAREHGYELRSMLISDDHQWMGCLAVKCGPAHQSSESSSLLVYDLGDDGSLKLAEVLEDVFNFVFGRNGTLFYTILNSKLRAHMVMCHQIGLEQSRDKAIFDEPNDECFVDITRTKDKRFYIVNSSKLDSSEVHVFSAGHDFMCCPSKDMVSPAMQVVRPRQKGVEYFVDHHDSEFVILTNSPPADGKQPPPAVDSVPFRLVCAPTASPTAENWTELLSVGSDERIEDVEIFKNYIMVSVKRQGCPAVFIYNRVSKRRSELQLPYNGSCAVQPEPNPNFEATTVRLGFSSPVHLKSVVESPTLVRVYGAYGVSLEPEFRLEDVPLLLRGWVIALAHVRGGSELGREWYSAGKGAKKPNSVEDFVACARFLLDKGWSGPERLAATGVSAGGLVVGAALNKCPEYFRAAALHVPFVDPLSAMLSPDLPLTSVEVSEWGDPFASAASYKAIRGYAPYDNIGEINSGGHGPSILVTAGGQDQRVSVWQPAKWVARLRRAGGYGSIAHSGGSNMSKLLFYPMMNAGHFHANTPEPSTDYDATGDTGFIGAQALRNAFLIRETSTGNR